MEIKYIIDIMYVASVIGVSIGMLFTTFIPAMGTAHEILVFAACVLFSVGIVVYGLALFDYIEKI